MEMDIEKESVSKMIIRDKWTEVTENRLFARLLVYAYNRFYSTGLRFVEETFNKEEKEVYHERNNQRRKYYW